MRTARRIRQCEADRKMARLIEHVPDARPMDGKQYRTRVLRSFP
jgi:hypothetical protein